MNILVTGGAGFIGSHIVDALVEQKHTVVVVDNLSTGKKDNIHPHARFYHLDICDNALEKVFRETAFDAVVHHAAQINLRRSLQDPYHDAQVNILGSLNLCKYAMRYRVKQFIFSSSASIYKDSASSPQKEDSLVHPSAPYGLSKWVIERYLGLYEELFNFRSTIFRYANVYGPRQNYESEAGVVAIFSDKLLHSQQPLVNGTGMQTRDFIFVTDVVRFNVLAIQRSVYGVFNIATGVQTSVNTILQDLQKLSRQSITPNYGDPIKGELERMCVDITRATKTFGAFEYVNLTKGLESTFRWFQSRVLA